MDRRFPCLRGEGAEEKVKVGCRSPVGARWAGYSIQFLGLVSTAVFQFFPTEFGCHDIWTLPVALPVPVVPTTYATWETIWQVPSPRMCVGSTPRVSRRADRRSKFPATDDYIVGAVQNVLSRDKSKAKSFPPGAVPAFGHPVPTPWHTASPVHNA
ncbi:unnamed protein product [Chondrus crispus]|uniref:Uncharacterized protein n=1 Tax=Chondrus crispus TaxID=2769 RepID=R7QSC3_CHOCR|nr:unnamed protein product [Chondrus crispus]CDF40994.1 unnamed protein product [Chondrus crispus]|eukprot:XP_005711288.1 unnamed protein product [Chondrus crispus]